jgi:CRP-like cAMP-binding protein
MSLSTARHEPAARLALPSLSPTSVTPLQVASTLAQRLGQLREIGSMQRFERNEAVFHEADAVRQVFQIVGGTIRLCRHTPDGRRHISDFALPGDICGSFVDATQSLTAEAVTDVAVIAYPRAHLDRLCEGDPRFRASVLAHLSGHLQSVQRHTFTLGCQNAKERLASFILRLAERTGAIHTGRLDLAMGRQDVADHLGLTIETISRTITALRKQHVLGVPSAHQFLLRDVDALIELAQGNPLN